MCTKHAGRGLRIIEAFKAKPYVDQGASMTGEIHGKPFSVDCSMYRAACLDKSVPDLCCAIKWYSFSLQEPGRGLVFGEGLGTGGDVQCAVATWTLYHHRYYHMHTSVHEASHRLYPYLKHGARCTAERIPTAAFGKTLCGSCITLQL